MEKKIKVKESCCACEANMEKEVKQLVDNVEKGHSKAEHDKKQKELDEAFDKGE